MSDAGTPIVGVLALQGDVREHLDALEASGARGTVVRRAGELSGVDGLVIPGGESTAMWKLAVAFDLLEPLRAAVGGGLPVYGSCAGMIMLADKVMDAAAGQETIGGIAMTVRRNAFGRQVDSFEEPIEFTGLRGSRGSSPDGRGDDRLHAVFIRAPWVEDVDADVEVLARVATGPAAGRIVAVRQENLLATSFHPELTGDHRVHEFFVRMVRGRADSVSHGK